jgi:hypothetical protein
LLALYFERAAQDEAGNFVNVTRDPVSDIWIEPGIALEAGSTGCVAHGRRNRY